MDKDKVMPKPKVMLTGYLTQQLYEILDWLDNKGVKFTGSLELWDVDAKSVTLQVHHEENGHFVRVCE
jgi:hypothetical protein